MKWILSQFRAGDCVEVRSKEEILATLDEKGCVDNLPFMPEMLRFCGQRFQVRAVAHKTCDTVKKSASRGRRLQATVHLAQMYCDGSSHGGCEARCTLFWKDIWLKPVNDKVERSSATIKSNTKKTTCSEAVLLSNTHTKESTKESPCYSCQATKLYEATQPLAFWDLRQYWFDVTTKNRSLSQVLRVTFLASIRAVVTRFQRGYRIHGWVHKQVTGRDAANVSPKIRQGEKTPEGILNLKEGEWVRIKSQAQIGETLNEDSKNRGLYYDEDEMGLFCGETFRVQSKVTKIIDEPTGKMITMKQPCITLEGVACKSEYSSCRLNCPRAIPSYWRELWLERVEKE